MWLLCFFFFSSRRRHTRWTGDWSSDVCSSDLVIAGVNGEPRGDRRGELAQEVEPADLEGVLPELASESVDRTLDRVGRLRSAGSTVRVGRGRVRKGACALEVVCSDVVRTAV